MSEGAILAHAVLVFGAGLIAGTGLVSPHRKRGTVVYVVAALVGWFLLLSLDWGLRQ